MSLSFNNLGLVFAAGALGGLVNGLVVWAFGHLGITAALGVKIAPELTPAMLYARIVWGGIWGFIFLLPFYRRDIFWRGIIYSLGPTLVQLFVVFPYKAGKGAAGLDLGILTPFFVIVFNAFWGWAAAIYLRLAKK
jgi:hypothetical protein